MIIQNKNNFYVKDFTSEITIRKKAKPHPNFMYEIMI